MVQKAIHDPPRRRLSDRSAGRRLRHGRQAAGAPPSGEPPAYFNLSAAGLQAALGRPAFVRKDGAIEMWRYDGAACRAFFFFYGAPLAVRHVETLPNGARAAADPACLNALRLAQPKVS
ncbi:hypothetical protein AYO42_05180 [Rhizomicrobium sp. SCGC AG-212-E05]|nr:hypothetical protein AYO42_05180 [Rhizomicrobium sp. SCGC AG-212-E05]